MSDLPAREEAQKIWEMAVDPDAFPDVSGDSIANRYELSAEVVYEAYVDGALRTAAEWRDSLESGHVISVAGHRKVKGPHDSQWELTGHSDMKWPLEYGKRFALVELPAAFGEQP